MRKKDRLQPGHYDYIAKIDLCGKHNKTGEVIRNSFILDPVTGYSLSTAVGGYIGLKIEGIDLRKKCEVEIFKNLEKAMKEVVKPYIGKPLNKNTVKNITQAIKNLGKQW